MLIWYQIGRQMVTTGKRYTPKEIERYVDAVTPDDIKRVANKYLWDKDVSSNGLARIYEAAKLTF